MDITRQIDFLKKLEKDNIKKIQKLNLLGYNLWKIYRHSLILSANSESKNKLAVVNQEFLKRNEVCMGAEELHLVRASSLLSSDRLINIKKQKLNYYLKAISLTQKNVKFAGLIYSHQNLKLEPEIHFTLDQAMASITTFFRKLFLPFILPTSMYHSFIFLNSCSISFRKITQIQATFCAKFWYIIYFIKS